MLTMLTIYSKMRTIQKPVKSFHCPTGCGSDLGQEKQMQQGALLFLELY